MADPVLNCRIRLYRDAETGSCSTLTKRGGTGSGVPESTPAGFCVFLSDPDPEPASSEISDFTPCMHAQTDILHGKYADKIDY